jgi:glycogen operon protein
LVRFVQSLIAMRRSNPTLRRRTFLSGVPARQGELPDVSWFNPEGGPVDWKNGESGLVCVFGAPRRPEVDERPTLIPQQGKHVMLLLNPVAQQREFIVPELVRAIHWRQFINTAADPPQDIWPELDGPEPPVRGPIVLAERSLQCYVAGG